MVDTCMTLSSLYVWLLLIVLGCYGCYMYDSCIIVDVLWLTCFDWCTMIDACMVSWCMYGCPWLILHYWYMAEILWIDDRCMYECCMHEGRCMIYISWGIMVFWMISEEYIFSVLRWKVICCYGPFRFLFRLELLHII